MLSISLLLYLLSLHLHKPRFHRMAFPNVHEKMQSYKYVYVCICKVLSRISSKDHLAIRAVDFLEYQGCIVRCIVYIFIGFLWLALTAIIVGDIVGKVYRGCLVVYYFPSPLNYCHDCLFAHLLDLTDSRCKLFGCGIGPLFYAKDDVLSRFLLVLTTFIDAKVVAETKSLLCNIAPASQVAINKKFAHDVPVVL
jgi:hypothetical protein